MPADGRDEPVGAALRRGPLLRLGERFGPRYSIVEQVGAGGMGTVYKAVDNETGQVVALKLIRSDRIARAGALTRFKRELALAQKVSHPNVYRVHDLGEVDGNAYISMQYIDGQSLEDLIHSMGHLSPRQTVKLGRQVCDGLQAIHENAIVHRDLKPSNIMVDTAGVARLMDFGLAYETGSEHLTSEGTVLGTMSYLSPEQARGERVGPPSDVFALGLILYEMLTGRRPPGDASPVPLAMRDNGASCPRPSQFVPEVPRAIDALVMRALERDPARRFPTAAALRAALDAIEPPSSGHATPARPLSRPSGAFVVQRSSRWPWLAAGSVVAVLAIAAARGWLAPRPAPAAAVAPIIGIAPWSVAAGDGVADDVSAGLADGLATDIGDGGCATVVARTEVARADPGGRSPGAAAARLGLTHVLSGSLSRSPAGYRVEMNLVAADGNVVSRVADADSDAFALRRRLADGLVGALCVGAARPVAAHGTTDVGAFLDYSHGLRLLERSDQPDAVAAAIASLEKAIAADPAFAMAHAALGDAYLAQYRIAPNEVLPGKALNAASEALRLAPRAPRVRLLYARAKRLMGSSASAAAELHALVEERPKDPEVHAALGALYVDLADWPNAVDHYQKALALRPDYWGSHARLGFAYLKMGRVDDAVAAYMHATVLQPDNAQALQMLGTAYVAQGDLPRARDSYSKAIALRPDSMSFLNLGTIEFDSGDFAAAKRSYARAVDLDEGRAALWRGLGDANAALGMRDDARRSFEECARLSRLAASLDGANAEALAEGAVCAQKLGDSAAAERDIARAVALAPKNGEVLYLSALVRLLQGRDQDAIAAVRDAVGSGYSAQRPKQDYEFRKLRDNAAFASALAAGPDGRH